MALARLAFKNLHQRVLCSSPAVDSSIGERAIGSMERQIRGHEHAKRFLATQAGDIKEPQGNNEGAKEVAVTKGKNKSSRLNRLLPRWPRRKNLWRDTDRDFSPALSEIFPSGLGNALMQATENMNRLFDSMSLTPFQLSGRMKEQDECYKLKFDMPGIPKDEVKITVDDGVLRIKGEHKEEDQEESDDEHWSSRRYYGYYDTSLVLPDDAKVDDIKAELKHGVLNIIVPKTEKSKKDVKEVQVD